nr:MAG TPA: hypothetical protein [Caudoviricetes sp.]
MRHCRIKATNNSRSRTPWGLYSSAADRPIKPLE